MSYDNEGQVIISKVISENPKAPALRVDVVINGVKHTAGLWAWDRKDGSKVVDKAGNGKYIGKLEVDTYEANQDQKGIVEANRALNAKADDFEDSIPF
tara:strand:+ start:472 stop:765 length:294 start_codon:yes stop_codon:yes gene_type:complete